MSFYNKVKGYKRLSMVILGDNGWVYVISLHVITIFQIFLMVSHDASMIFMSGKSILTQNYKSSILKCEVKNRIINK